MERDSSKWRGKLKGVGKIWWDKETGMYTPEGEGRSIYPGSVDGSKESEDVIAGRDCILRAM